MTRRVLVTRTADGCGELQAMLAPSGLEVAPYPVLRFAEVSDDPGWDEVLAEIAPGDSAWLVFASPRAARPFVRQADARGGDHLRRLPVATVGRGTAAAVRAAGLDVDLVGPGTGAGLAAALLERFSSRERIVFPAGRDRRPEMPEILASAGHRVLPVVVYRMDETPREELPRLPPGLEAVVLTSPRAARLYANGVGARRPSCTHWALGPTTRAAAARLGIDCRIPDEPDLTSLVEELCRT